MEHDVMLDKTKMNKILQTSGFILEERKKTCKAKRTVAIVTSAKLVIEMGRPK